MHVDSVCSGGQGLDLTIDFRQIVLSCLIRSVIID